jgi:hypothetical protein
MGTITLHPKDCARLGVTGPIPFNLVEVGIRQRTAFETATKRPYGWLIDQLRGVPELDEHNNPIPVPVLNEDSSPKLDENNEPVVRMRLTRHPDALPMLVWLALWGHGIRVPWDDKDGEVVFDLIADGLRINYGADETEEDGEEEDDEGKAPTDSAATTSP